MISEVKVEANRENALSSTGPKTPEGKSKSSMNALKHGLRARKAVLLPHESEEEFESMRKAMLYELDPRGMTECIIAEMVIDSAWRLRRIPIFETQVLAYAQNRITKHHPDWDKEFPNGPHSQERAEWGRAWQLSETSMVNLRRYENALSRTFFKGLSVLRDADKNRSYIASRMPHHPEIAADFPPEPPSPMTGFDPKIDALLARTPDPVPPASTPPAYSTVLESGMSAPPASTPPAERTDPGHVDAPPSHNPLPDKDLSPDLASFGKQDSAPLVQPKVEERSADSQTK